MEDFEQYYSAEESKRLISGFINYQLRQKKSK